MKNIVRWLTLPALLALTVGFGSVPVAADHVPAKHQNMDLLFSSGGTGATNSDLAFWGKYAYQGYYNGFKIFDISNPAAPTLVRDFACPGPQNDISVFDRDGNGQADILFLSVDSVMENSQCGAAAVAAADVEDPDGWEGIRIFDISNPAQPKQIGAVYQDCGSHTHTLWPDAGNYRVLLWNSSYPLRPGPTCGPTRGPAVGRDPLHGVIQIVQVGWDAANPLGPITAGEIAEPPINYPGDPDNKFDPQEHTDVTTFGDLRACHDIGVFVGRSLAGGACAEQAQLWRVKPNGIPDTANPIWVYDDPVDETGVTGNANDPGVKVDFWHSATFSWDGKVVNFIDESFDFLASGNQACPPTSTGGSVDGDTGRMFFLDTATGKKLSHFMIPRTEADAYCTSHLGIPVLTNDRYLLVNAWYQGGVDVIDFTNPASPQEIAYWDFNPNGPTGSDNWAAYWYEGPQAPGGGLTIYATDGFGAATTARGFEVFRGNVAVKEGNLTHLNPQTQTLLCRGVAGTVFGTPDADIIEGTNAADVIVGGDGNDRIFGLTGDDLICGGAGRDKVSGSGGDDRIYGEDGNDNLRGNAGKDTLVGGRDKDRCHGGPGKDKIGKSCEKVIQP